MNEPRSQPLGPGEAYRKALAVKRAHERELLEKPNVVGVGVGLRQKDGVLTDIISLVVMVTRKVAHAQLDSQGLIPSEIDGVPVDVQEVGEIKAI